MSAFGTQLRRGPGWWVAAAMVALGLLLAFSSLQTVSVWSFSTGAVANSPFVMGAVAIGGGAWLGSGTPRRGVIHLERLSARGAWSAAAVEIAALVTWALVAYLVVMAVVFVPTASSATWGGPSWLWLAVAAAGLAVHVPLGWLAGRAMPWRLTAFATSVGWFVLTLWWDTSPAAQGWWRRLFPALQWHLRPTDGLRTGPLWGQLGWFLGLALGVLVVAAVAGGDRLRTVSRLAVGAAVFGVTGVGVVVATEPGRTAAFVEPGRHLEWVCAGDAPEVCVHPAVGGVLPQMQRQAETVAGRLAGTPFAIARAEHRPRGGQGTDPSPGAAAFGLDWPTQQDVERAGFELATYALGVGPACFDPDTGETAPGLGPMLPLVVWAADSDETVVGPDAEALSWLGSRTDDQMRAWFVAHESRIRTCTLTYADLS